MAQMKEDLIIYMSIYDKNPSNENTDAVMISDAAAQLFSKDFVHYLFCYRTVTLLCSSIDFIPSPLWVAIVTRLASYGKCIWKDDYQTRRITVISIINIALGYIRDHFVQHFFLKSISKEIDSLGKRFPVAALKQIDYCAYVRTDEPCHLRAGGSVGHIAGVINSSKQICGKVVYISTEMTPLVNDNIEYRELPRIVPYRNIKDINSIAYNKTSFEGLCVFFAQDKPNVIYHRYSLGSYAVAKYSIIHQVPYILEYNGSELWIIKNWHNDNGNTTIRHYELLYDIEKLVLQKASLITCVSDPLRQQLIDMGIAPEKILVNPNGVNTDLYYPELPGNQIREKYSIGKSMVVIGFIGTFGMWHGVERLASVYVELSKQHENIHLLLIGDGMKMPEVKGYLAEVSPSRYTLTGMVPQDEGPQYLAACDILVSPTVPNPDGTPFFGSPTKVFEYMAMGKAIVASNLDQMSELFEHERTALLCEPGDDSSLYIQLQRLIVDPDLRAMLAKNVRLEAVQKHTWLKHTERIIDAYRRLYS